MHYRVQERHIIIAILIMELVGTVLGLINQVVIGFDRSVLALTSVLLVTTLVLIGLGLTGFNWKVLAQVNLAIITGFIVLTFIVSKSTVTVSAIYAPIGIALLSAPWPGVLATVATLFITLIFYTLKVHPPLDLASELLTLGGVGLAIALGRFFFDRRERELANALASTEAARTSAETFAAQADERTLTLQSQSEAQRQLLETIAALETPAIEVAEGVLLAPLIGHFDSQRADDLIRRLLATITTRHAQTVILDISGLSVIDTAVAQQLIQLARSVHLLGSKIVLSGISPEIATTLVQLDVHLGVDTAPNPRAALAELRAMR